MSNIEILTLDNDSIQRRRMIFTVYRPPSPRKPSSVNYRGYDVFFRLTAACGTLNWMVVQKRVHPVGKGFEF